MDGRKDVDGWMDGWMVECYRPSIINALNQMRLMAAPLPLPIPNPPHSSRSFSPYVREYELAILAAGVGGEKHDEKVCGCLELVSVLQPQ